MSPGEGNKSHRAGSSTSTEKTLRYWDPDLETEVIITRNVRRDAPASPLRDVENPAQGPQSQADESPEISRGRSCHVGADHDKNADETDEDELIPRAPKRHMITLGMNKHTLSMQT